MGAVYFYHLTRSATEEVLPTLLNKSRAAGWRVFVRGTRRDRLDWLDEKLWLGPDDAFLAHGREGGPYDTDQPILLGQAGIGNGAQALMAIDGAQVSVEEATDLTRASILFDGQDGDAVQAARDQWKRLTSAGIAAQYWSQDSGSWAMKAESPKRG